MPLPDTLPATKLQSNRAVPLDQADEKGAIGIAFLVWLFGGGLGVAIFVFVLLKVC